MDEDSGSSKANHPKVSQARSSEKGKSWRCSMRSSSNDKEVIGSSSRMMINAGKPLIKPRNTLTSQFETDSSETSSVQDEPEISGLTPPVILPRRLQAEEERAKAGNLRQMEVGRYSLVSNGRSKRDFCQRPGLNQQDIKSTGLMTHGVSSRNRPRNLRCISKSDVTPDACSSSDSTLNRRKGVIQKRNSEGESSSTVRGKVTGSSSKRYDSDSRSGVSISDARGSKNIPSHRDCSRASVRTQRSDSSETSSVQDEPEISGLTAPPPVKFPRGLQAEEESAKSGNVIQMELGRSSIVSKGRSKRDFHQRPGLHQQDVKSTGLVTHGVSSRYRQRDVRCISKSVVTPDACSSSDSTLNRRNCVIQKRNSEGESSSTVRGKVSGSSSKRYNSGSRNGVSISDARGSKNIPSHRDSSRASVRTQRSVGGHVRERFSSQDNENPGSTNESSVMLPLLPHSIDHNDPGISFHTSGDALPVSLPEYVTPSFLINQDSIAEVALSGEELSDEELSDEQLEFLDTNFFLNGLELYDPHRDMRLDVDNMSYEELLALEERMGNVSTALTEEALSECLKRSIYLSALSDDAAINEDNADTKCCICQEEYVIEDEVGTLQCIHKFHVVCIEEWLRWKNFCPICKESAALSNSSRH